MALLLPLLFALFPSAASARVHVYRQAPAARFHRISAVHYARPHRVWTATYAGHWRFRAAAASWPRHFAATPWARRHFAQRVRSMPAVAFYHSGARARPVPAIAFQRGGAAGGSIVAEAMRFVGAGNVTGMRGAWCADYASMILRRTGHHALANRTVSAALAYGPRVSQPRPGDLVIINTRAGYASHVGFFAGWDHGRMLMVSGNWGHRVAVAPVSPRSVAAFIGV